MKLRIIVTSLALISTAGSVAAAQPGNAPGDARRELLEERLRQRTGEVVRRRLGLNDDQMRQLQATNSQFEQQRIGLVTREREARRSLREQLMSANPDQNKVGQLLDQTMAFERQRLDLIQNEQRDLARFLTPVQRAKLFGLQNGMRKRAQEVRGQRMKRKGMPPMPE